MEILSPEQYLEYERFILPHPLGSITQSTRWHGVKSNWVSEVVVSRGEDGEIAGAMSVLVQKIPFFGVTMLYSPRGPVCDLHDAKVLADLKKGADELAKKHNLPFFVVTDGASAINNVDCEAVEHARKAHIEWELKHGVDPHHDWGQPRRSCRGRWQSSR